MLFNPNWTELDEVGKVLMCAAEHIEKHGWCQREYTNHKGQVCLFGSLALNDLVAQSPDTRRAAQRLSSFLGDVVISTWNDNVCESQEQAVATLRAAAYYK